MIYDALFYGGKTFPRDNFFLRSISQSLKNSNKLFYYELIYLKDFHPFFPKAQWKSQFFY